MDIFNVNKRTVLSFEDFLKDGKKSEDAKHVETGEADIVKKSMSDEVDGPKGYTTDLTEARLNEMYGHLVNKQVLDDYLKLEYEVDENDIIEKTYVEIKNAISQVLKKCGFAQYKSELDELMEGNIFEKDFSVEQREKLFKKGFAMPDGSFPISTTKDLENAIKAHGRAKDPEAVKKFIKKRAKEMNKISLIPKEWN